MRFRAILVVESEDIDVLFKKMDKLGNFTIIDVYDSEKKRWTLKTPESIQKITKILMGNIHA